MNVVVFGLGYVGSVTAACFAQAGHKVTGVDINPNKVDLISKGDCPVTEPDLVGIIKLGVESGNLQATNDSRHALQDADVAVICVGTPSDIHGGIDLKYLLRVCQEIGEALCNVSNYVVIVIRSTVIPGVVEDQLIPLLEEYSGKVAGRDFGVCYNPEFLREGSAIRDFYNPPFTIIGQIDEKSGDILAQLYKGISAPIFRLSLGSSTMIKYASNAFHALKVVFANEIGSFCEALGIDSHEVMDVFVQDKKLNLSPYYLKPGFSFGGSCLPKDMRAILYTARHANLEMPVLEAIIPSNKKHSEKALCIIDDLGKKKIGLIGLSFKANTDDLRESPAVELAERLIGKGYELHVYDRDLSFENIFGTNRQYIESVMPHIGSQIRNSMEEVIRNSEILIITKKLKEDEYKLLLDSVEPDQLVLDLIRIADERAPSMRAAYKGICW